MNSVIQHDFHAVSDWSTFSMACVLLSVVQLVFALGVSVKFMDPLSLQHMTI